MIIQEKVPAFSLSIIIPALNEETELPRVLASLAAQADAPPFEVVLADGGSTDGTVALYREWTGSHTPHRLTARCVVCPRSGRAAQMNMGARNTTGKSLLFLHADTLLPPEACRAIVQTLADPLVIGGGFRHTFTERGVLLRLISSWATMRSRLTGIHLGDQAIFVRRGTFEAIGGFQNVPLFEDLRLSRALRARGRLVTLPLSVATSARRLRRAGVLKMALRFAWLELRHMLGVDPAELKDEYPEIR